MHHQFLFNRFGIYPEQRRLTIQAFRSATLRIPRLVRASAPVRIVHVIKAETARSADITSNATRAARAIGSRKGGIAEFVTGRYALVGKIASCLRRHYESSALKNRYDQIFCRKQWAAPCFESCIARRICRIHCAHPSLGGANYGFGAVRL